MLLTETDGQELNRLISDALQPFQTKALNWLAKQLNVWVVFRRLKLSFGLQQGCCFKQCIFFLPLLFGKAVALNGRCVRCCHPIIAVKVAENCLADLVYVKNQSAYKKQLKFCVDTVTCAIRNSCLQIWFGYMHGSVDRAACSVFFSPLSPLLFFFFFSNGANGSYTIPGR